MAQVGAVFILVLGEEEITAVLGAEAAVQLVNRQGVGHLVQVRAHHDRWQGMGHNPAAWHQLCLGLQTVAQPVSPRRLGCA